MKIAIIKEICKTDYDEGIRTIILPADKVDISYSYNTMNMLNESNDFKGECIDSELKSIQFINKYNLQE